MSSRQARLPATGLIAQGVGLLKQVIDSDAVHNALPPVIRDNPIWVLRGVIVVGTVLSAWMIPKGFDSDTQSDPPPPPPTPLYEPQPYEYDVGIFDENELLGNGDGSPERHTSLQFYSTPIPGPADSATVRQRTISRGRGRGRGAGHISRLPGYSARQDTHQAHAPDLCPSPAAQPAVHVGERSASTVHVTSGPAPPHFDTSAFDVGHIQQSSTPNIEPVRTAQPLITPPTSPTRLRRRPLDVSAIDQSQHQQDARASTTLCVNCTLPTDLQPGLDEGKWLRRRADSLNEEAGRVIFAAHNPKLVGPQAKLHNKMVIDLHNQYLKPAAEYVRKYTDDAQKQGFDEITFIVGIGRNSDDHEPKIKPFIETFLRKELQMEFGSPPRNLGRIIVKLPKNTAA